VTYTDATKRHDFVLLFDVADGNPNGDPDAGNLPRVDPETMRGLVTDVALKRKVRDYLAVCHKQQIFIQSRDALNTLILNAFRAVGVQPPQIIIDDEELLDWFEQNEAEDFSLEDGSLIYGGESAKENDIRRALLEGPGDESGNQELKRKLQGVARKLAGAAKDQRISAEQRDQARDRLCRDYYDIRMFGAVLQTGLNAGQVRGPAQLTFARSIDPIFPLDHSITRRARTTTARMRTGPTEMGRKPTVSYGLYRAHGFFNPYLAEQTGVSDDDLALFWEALRNLFEFDRSASRGDMGVCGLYVFTHDSKLGNASARRLFDLIRVDPVQADENDAPPRRFSDYTVLVDRANVPKGVTLEVLVG